VARSKRRLKACVELSSFRSKETHNRCCLCVVHYVLLKFCEILHNKVQRKACLSVGEVAGLRG